jgi:hypothetical protein
MARTTRTRTRLRVSLLPPFVDPARRKSLKSSLIIETGDEAWVAENEKASSPENRVEDHIAIAT